MTDEPKAAPEGRETLTAELQAYDEARGKLGMPDTPNVQAMFHAGVDWAQRAATPAPELAARDGNSPAKVSGADALVTPDWGFRDESLVGAEVLGDASASAFIAACQRFDLDPVVSDLRSLWNFAQAAVGAVPAGGEPVAWWNGSRDLARPDEYAEFPESMKTEYRPLYASPAAQGEPQQPADTKGPPDA